MSERDLILLALDNVQVLHLMERALQAVNFEVVIAHNLEELEKILDEASPALVLIAEHFSGRNGIEIAEAELQRFPTLPILLFVEQDTTGVVKAVLKAGLSGYLYPPLHTDDIVDAVNRSSGTRPASGRLDSPGSQAAPLLPSKREPRFLKQSAINLKPSSPTSKTV